MDYNLEDLRPLKEETIEKRIMKSSNMSRVVLYLNFKLKNGDPNFSVKANEISEFFKMDHGYVLRMLYDLENLGILKKVKSSYKDVVFKPLNDPSGNPWITKYAPVAYKKIFGKEMK